MIRWARSRGCGKGGYCQVPNAASIILLGGGSKNRQQRDIDRAVDLWEQYKQKKALQLQNKKTNSVKNKKKG